MHRRNRAVVSVKRLVTIAGKFAHSVENGFHFGLDRDRLDFISVSHNHRLSPMWR